MNKVSEQEERLSNGGAGQIVTPFGEDILKNRYTEGELKMDKSELITQILSYKKQNRNVENIHKCAHNHRFCYWVLF